MQAVVFHGIGDIRLEDVPEPKLQEQTDAIVRLTASAICGTDLHMVRGTLGGMEPGTVLGHEGVGVVEELGRGVRNLKRGDRVVIPSTIACGDCSYCRAGYYSQCDRANPNGPQAGSAFFGGPKLSGPFHGLQAEWARIPYAQVGPVKLPEEVSDDQAVLLSDIFPTGYFGADLAGLEPGRTVAIFGCGPVGQFAIASARLMDAGRVLAVDCIPSRLEMARGQGAEVIDFSREDPVAAIQELTGGIGVDRAIDAVGVDATHGNVRVASGRSENAGRGAGLPSRSRPIGGSLEMPRAERASPAGNRSPASERPAGATQAKAGRASAGEKYPAPEPDRPSSGGGDEGEPTNGRRGGAAPASLRRAAAQAHAGPAVASGKQHKQFEQERQEIVAESRPNQGNWNPGDAPSQVLDWAVRALAKAGTLAIIGVYPDLAERFPVGVAMNRNLTVRMGNCNHRKYLPKLIRLVASGVVRPELVLTQREPMTNALDAYRAFDRREPGWIKVELTPDKASAEKRLRAA